MPFETIAIIADDVERTPERVTAKYEEIAAAGGKIVAHSVIELISSSPNRNRGRYPHIMLVAEFPEEENHAK